MAHQANTSATGCGSLCADFTYSSVSSSGACSHHGGVMIVGPLLFSLLRWALLLGLGAYLWRRAVARKPLKMGAWERGHKTLALATRALGLVELLVPKRIANEEIGDAMEQILQMVERGCPRWHVYLKVTTTVFGVLLHAIRAAGRYVARRKKS